MDNNLIQTEQNSKLKIEEILLAAAEFLQNPNDEEKINAFEEIKRNTTVRAFLPIAAKMIILERLIRDINLFPDEIYDFAGAFEICSTFDAILSYTNVDLNFDPILKDYEYYDILWQSGYCDYVLDFCKRDYERLINMAWQMIDYNNLKQLLDALSRIDSSAIENLGKKIDKIKTEINPEIIKNLSNIVAGNDSLLTGIKNEIEQKAFDAVKTIEKRSGE